MDTGNDCRAEDQSLEAIKLLWMFINKHASDLNEVSLQLKNAAPHESSCEMTLNCIANDIISCFLVSSAPDLNHSFVAWVITRILRLLASELCHPLHPKALECFSSILHLWRRKDIAIFSLLVKELCQLLSDLFIVSMRVFHEGCPVKLPIYCAHFQHLIKEKNIKEDPELVLSKKLIELNSARDCALLQASLCDAVTELSQEIVLFGSEMLNSLWVTLAEQLRVSGTLVKEHTLWTVAALLEHGTNILVNIRDHVIHCVMALLVKVIQAHHNHSIQFAKLTLPLVNILRQVYIKKRNFITLAHWDELANTLHRVLVMGVKGLSPDLQEVIGDLLYCMTELRPSSTVKLTWTACDVIGHVANCQPFVGAFSWAVYKESQQDNATNTQAPVTVTPKKNVVKLPHLMLKKTAGSDKRLRRCSSVIFTQSPAPQNKEAVSTFTNRLIQRLTQMLNVARQLGDNTEALILALEGIRAVMEIHFRAIVRKRQLNCWFNTWDLSQVVHSFETILATVFNKHSTIDVKSLEKIYYIMCDAIGAVFAASLCADYKISVSTMDCLCWIISLPWEESDVTTNWSSVVGGGSLIAQQRKEIKIRLLEIASGELLVCSFRSFAVMPVDKYSILRKQILQLAMGNKELKILPNLGAYCSQIEDNQLLKHLIMSTSHDDITEGLITVLPSLLTVYCSNEPVKYVFDTNKLLVPLHYTSSIKVVATDADKISPSLGYLQMLQSDSNQSARQMFLLYWNQLSPFIIDIHPFNEAFLAFITSSSYTTRKAFSSHVLNVFSDDELSSVENHVLVQQLNDAFVVATNDDNPRLRETVAYTFGKIAKHCNGETFNKAVICLLGCLLDSSSLVESVAFTVIKKICKQNKVNNGRLLAKMKAPVAEFIVTFLHDKSEEVLSKIAAVFDYQTIKSLLLSCLKELLPRVIMKLSQETSNILENLAEILERDKRELLVENFKFIFPYLVCHCDPGELPMVLNIIRLKTENVEMESLFRSEAQALHNQLILHYSAAPDQVMEGLKLLASVTSDIQHDRSNLKDGDIAKLLSPRLLGILAFFQTQLDSCVKDDTSRGQLVLHSLIGLIKLMGPFYITPVRVKLMGILRVGLQFKDEKCLELCCQAWLCFVKNLEPECLGVLLSQLVVTLSSLMNSYPKIVAEALNYLIIEHRAITKPHFMEVFDLSDHPMLVDVNTVLKQSSGEKNPVKLLRNVLKGVSHENADVRSNALCTLKKLLTEDKVQLHKLILGNELVDPLVVTVIKMLLSACCDQDLHIRKLLGECLGELGAIDPRRIQISTVIENKPFVMHELDDGSGEFAVGLLKGLARAYLTATSSDNTGYKIWNEIPSELQEVLKPHFNSRYITQKPLNNDRTTPIFRPKRQLSLSEWVNLWSLHLLNSVVDSKAKKVFDSCSLIFKHDMQIALYLLPYILTFVLKEGSDTAVEEAKEEMMAVINHCTSPANNDQRVMFCQTIFSTLDHVMHWMRTKDMAIAEKRKGIDANLSRQLPRVKQFICSLPKDQLSLAAFHCRAHARSLLWLEENIRENPDSLQKNIAFLQNLYASMDEPDGVTGAAAVRKEEPSLHEQILQHESTGNVLGAAVCFQKAIEQHPNKLTDRVGYLKCMMASGQLSSALVYVNNLENEKPEWMRCLNSVRVEASWRLSQWGDLEHFLAYEPPANNNWNIGIGRLLLSVKKQNSTMFQSQLEKLYTSQMYPLSAASMDQGSYSRAYEYIVRLHMLKELEQGVNKLQLFEGGEVDDDSKKELTSMWNERFQFIQTSFHIMEPVLNLRRVILGLSSRMSHEVGDCWLQSTKVARRARQLQIAHTSLLHAEDYHLPELCIEKAKYIREQGDHLQALVSLQKAIDVQWPPTSDGSRSNVEAHAKGLLLLARWMEGTARYETQAVLKQYKNVLGQRPEFEDGHFYLAKYYDRLMAFLAGDRPSKLGEFLQFVLRHYGSALRYGNKYIYQCMPRLLSLWLDFGAKVTEEEERKPRESPQIKSTLMLLNKMISDFTEMLPPYQFLVAFSQLVSRVTHPNMDVFYHIEAIVLKLLRYFPQQALWMMIAISKSTYPERQQRCKRILEKAMSQIPQMDRLIDDVVKLTDRLLEVCNKKVEGQRLPAMVTMDKMCRSLARLTSASGFSSIMVPIQSSLTVTLPMSKGSHQDHNPFPGEIPYIVKFNEKVEILASLQKPKKISILASDGKSYTMLCKPEDDLRKDSRLMEFNTIVNKCLRNDAECRRRQLYIRTYSVVPLNEKCGLLEWVHNTNGLRQILNKIYQQRGMYTTGKELKEIAKAVEKDPEIARDVFLNQLLPKFPAVFDEWFLHNFPDPTAWYQARVAYIRTCAVMSIVGYILGLGDRHGENILFDSTNGDCVHVDFNCLFNRGEQLGVPERVPFRLTHNMVHAMGITGYEGIFRKSCEVTLRLLREQSDPLMCVLKTFIHDPLVEWNRGRGRSESTLANKETTTSIKNIEDRLLGNFPKAKGLPLSIEGQVHSLIQEATDIDNLSKMFIGWAAYM
ncbi:serine/threonine-protein kinase ATR-like isoform X5 [Dysidea avara]|uniref:serine/threonine-protein kinase ATR-like isoform X5 n=1 Tax=Dysidea avara TaxID=196820 RepID=UPI003332BEF9